MPSYAHVGVHMKQPRRKSSIASIEDWSVSGLAKALAGVGGDDAKQMQRQNREEDYHDGYKDDDSDVSAEPAWRPGESEIELGGEAWGEDKPLRPDSASSLAKAQAARKREDIRNQLKLSKSQVLQRVSPPPLFPLHSSLLLSPRKITDPEGCYFIPCARSQSRCCRTRMTRL